MFKRSTVSLTYTRIAHAQNSYIGLGAYLTDCFNNQDD
jgi:hypothetical protein